MSIEELIDENDRLHEQIEGLVSEMVDQKAQIEHLQSLVRRMAAELDSRDAPSVDSGPEVREWFGTVEWSGSTAAYEANAGEINRYLAQTISKLANGDKSPPERPKFIESLPKVTPDDLQKASPIDASAWEDDRPEGRPYSP